MSEAAMRGAGAELQRERVQLHVAAFYTSPANRARFVRDVYPALFPELLRQQGGRGADSKEAGEPPAGR